MRICDIRRPMGRRAADLAGKVFGRLSVVERAGSAPKSGAALWHCRCDCGGVATVVSTSLTKGLTRSCGCWLREFNRVHGRDTSDRTYACWAAMMHRCKAPKNKSYHNYGGRGITVCERWLKFENFLADMGEKPAGLTLDRIDNDGNYEPSNCRWADRVTQNRNRRTRRVLLFRGERRSLAEWAEAVGIPRWTVWQRLDAGWSVNDALTSPVRRRFI